MMIGEDVFSKILSKIVRFVEGVFYAVIVILVLYCVTEITLIVGKAVGNKFSTDPLIVSTFFIIFVAVGLWNASNSSD